MSNRATATGSGSFRGGAMRISKLTIKNFRNFQSLEVGLADHAVIVGPNGVGKSNLLHALRLVLDPSLPDSLRQLRREDFWDGCPRPLKKGERIEVSIELSDLDGNDDVLASLGDHLVETDPKLARLTYVFRAKPKAKVPLTADDFEWFVFGGDDEENRVSHEVRRRLPADLIHALRDAETDLATWRRSPLRPLLERAWANVSDDDKEALAEKLNAAGDELTSVAPIEELQSRIAAALAKRADGSEATDVRLGVAPRETASLVRVIRVLLDEGRRPIGESSLGLANLLFFTLKLLELRHLVDEHERDHTFVAIEEPEAHLHPHLQRQMFRSFLRLRPHQRGEGDGELEAMPTSILVTTHSPHLASISPLRTLVSLRRERVEVEGLGEVLATVGSSTSGLELSDRDVEDLERYLEISRAELLFARGVILVEGDAEQYLVPKIAALVGKRLDASGISVCSVGGTHFQSYARFLACLQIPFAVVTDGDPASPWPGAARVSDLLKAHIGPEAYAKIAEGDRVAQARKHGFFVGTTTIETDLLASGRVLPICRALAELGVSAAAKRRADAWAKAKKVDNEETMLKDIAAIGKGRFAQRLATVMQKRKNGSDPSYIVDAITFVSDRATV